ncbi:hypothetical protein [Mumia zhuanghuii]|nr:hypothetical protein [Mumia zhuanghuii]
MPARELVEGLMERVCPMLCHPHGHDALYERVAMRLAPDGWLGLV